MMRKAFLGFVVILLFALTQNVSSKKFMETRNGRLSGKSNANIGDLGNFKTVRRKRSYTPVVNLTAEQQQECVDEHNRHRATETESSDMRFMSWNHELALLAQAWTDLCDFVHGQPDGYTTEKWGNNVGQNLYFTTVHYSPTFAMERFWEEKEMWNWNYDDLSCDPNGICGHYTQMAWASSYEVGCGYTFCETMTDTDIDATYSNTYYFACNYGPPGNFDGVKPFKKGGQCNECDNGKYWCYDGLCRDCLDDGVTENCTCKATTDSLCQNCYAVSNDCECTCYSGYYKDKCQDYCTNLADQCASYPADYCTNPSFGPQVVAACPKLCGTCTSETDTPGECVIPTTQAPTTEAPTTQAPTTETTTTEAPTTQAETTQAPTTEATTTQAPTTETTTTQAPTTEAETTQAPTTEATTTQAPTTETTTTQAPTTEAETTQAPTTEATTTQAPTTETTTTQAPTTESTMTQAPTTEAPTTETVATQTSTTEAPTTAATFTTATDTTTASTEAPTTSQTGTTGTTGTVATSTQGTTATQSTASEAPVQTTQSTQAPTQPQTISTASEAPVQTTQSTQAPTQPQTNAPRTTNQVSQTATRPIETTSSTVNNRQTTSATQSTPSGGNRNTRTTSGAETTITAISPTQGSNGNCDLLQCTNAGEPTLFGLDCRCVCPDEWQGDTCEFRVEEAIAGIVLTIAATLDQWDDLWEAIKPLLFDSVNVYCDETYEECCSHAGPRVAPAGTEYITSSDYLAIGIGYPKNSKQVDGSIEILLYTNYDYDNQLCGQTQRRKRSADEEILTRKKRAAPLYLPQDAMLAAVLAITPEISNTTMDCCGATLLYVNAAVVEEKNYSYDEGGLGGGAIAGIVIGVLVLIALIAGIIVFAMTQLGKSQQDEDEKHRHENGHHNPHHVNDRKFEGDEVMHRQYVRRFSMTSNYSDNIDRFKFEGDHAYLHPAHHKPSSEGRYYTRRHSQQRDDSPAGYYSNMDDYHTEDGHRSAMSGRHDHGGRHHSYGGNHHYNRGHHYSDGEHHHSNEGHHHSNGGHHHSNGGHHHSNGGHHHGDERHHHNNGRHHHHHRGRPYDERSRQSSGLRPSTVSTYFDNDTPNDSEINENYKNSSAIFSPHM